MYDDGWDLINYPDFTLKMHKVVDVKKLEKTSRVQHLTKMKLEHKIECDCCHDNSPSKIILVDQKSPAKWSCLSCGNTFIWEYY